MGQAKEFQKARVSGEELLCPVTATTTVTASTTVSAVSTTSATVLALTLC